MEREEIKLGNIVTLDDGRKAKITLVHPDFSFECDFITDDQEVQEVKDEIQKNEIEPEVKEEPKADEEKETIKAEVKKEAPKKTTKQAAKPVRKTKK
jgi:hypothetical protein